MSLLLYEGHYCCIRYESRLLHAQVGGRIRTKYYCERCLNPFSRGDLLEKYPKYFRDHDAVRTTVPAPGAKLKFKNYGHGMRVPLVVYADSECFTQKIGPVSVGEHTTRYQHHVPSGYAFLVKCYDDGLYSLFSVGTRLRVQTKTLTSILCFLWQRSSRTSTRK